jgi:hypothetical protein
MPFRYLSQQEDIVAKATTSCSCMISPHCADSTRLKFAGQSTVEIKVESEVLIVPLFPDWYSVMVQFLVKSWNGTKVLPLEP